MLLLAMIDAAKIAGDKALAMQRDIAQLPINHKGNEVRDIFTAADKEAQRLAVERLGQNHSHIPIIGEEGNNDNINTLLHEKCFITIDPIDGTTNYSHGSKNWGTMIGLIKYGKPVAGVIYLPALGQLYAAEKGNGLIRFHEPAQKKMASAATSLAQCIIGLESGWWLSDIIAKQQFALIKKASGPHMLLSAAVGLGELLEGITGCYVNLHEPDKGASIWDFVPGAALMAELWQVSVDEVCCNPQGGAIDWSQEKPQAIFHQPSTTLRQEILATLAENA